MIEQYISNLDTLRFGFKVAKFTNSIKNPCEIVEKLRGNSTKLIIARVELKNILLINQLENIGFEYKDCQVTFNYDIRNNIIKNDFSGFVITTYKKHHLQNLIDLTKQSFDNYGHYFADDKLDKLKCLEIYTDWIEKCCTNDDFADNIVVAEKNGVAIGYLALKTYHNEKERYIAGVIGAVDSTFRKLGVFQAINKESINLAKRIGMDRIENNVLITNFPVMKTYTSLSYNIIRSEITMHCWL